MKKRTWGRRGLCVCLGVFLILTNGAPVFASESQTLTAFFRDIKIVVDGNLITPQDSNGNVIEPFIVNGTAYLPIRAVGEAVGKTVDWDASTNTVYLGDGAPSSNAASFKVNPNVQNSRQQNLGSAKNLSGNVNVVSCFISDRYNQWTYAEKMHMVGLNNEAQAWLTEQASRYGMKVNFENACYGLENDIYIDYLPTMFDVGKERNITTVLNKIGWDSSMQFYEDQISRTNCDNMIVLIFLKGAGQSYAIPYTDPAQDRKLYYLEGAVLYQQFLYYGMEINASSLAHEILHVFGSWDLYNTYLHAYDVETTAREMFPNSIMYRVSDNINDLNIDEVTSWLIGWHDKPEPWYEWFKPHW